MSQDKDKKKTTNDHRPRNLGPSGFALYDYLGKGRDHSTSWLKFKKNIKGAILTNKLDKLVEKIIERGIRPTVPPIDRIALSEQAPKRKIKVSDLLDDDGEGQTFIFDESAASAESDSGSHSDSKSKAKTVKKSAKAAASTSVLKEEIDNPDYDIEMAGFLEEVKVLRRKRVERQDQLDRDIETFYSIMWLHCGLAMQNFVKSLRGYETKSDANDALWLYKALEAIGNNTAAVVETDAQANTFFALAGIQMYSHVDVHTHVERWKQAYTAFVASGNQDLLSAVQVDMCCRSLHDGFANYKVEFQNRKNRKEKIPGSLDELLWEASQHVTVVVPITNDQRAVYAIGDARVNLKKPRNPKPKPKAAIVAAAAAAVKDTNPAPADKSDKSKQRRGPTPDHILDNPNYWKDKTCNLCHKYGHPQARCPDLARAAEEEEEDEKPAAAAVALKSAGKPKRANLLMMIACTGSIPSRYLLALDDGAYSSVLCNEEFMSEPVRGGCPPLLTWTGSSHSNEAHGHLHPFGYCELNRKAPINLLSEFEVRARFRLEDRYDGHGPADGVMRNPSSKVVHVGNVEIEFKLDATSRQYVVDWRLYRDAFTYSPNMHGVNVVIHSVRQNEAMHSKDEVRRARLARDFIARTGYASKEDVMRLVSSSGNIVNVDITRADVERAVDIYGAQEVLQGRSRLLRPDTRVVRAAPVAKPPQSLYCDKFVVGGVWFMIANVKPMSLLMVQHAPGGTADALNALFAIFVSTLQSYQVDTSVIYNDADASALANINRLSRTRIENCAAGDHVDEAESPIRTVKERIRSIKAGLLFRLTVRRIIELVKFVVGRINCCISQYSPDGLCPRVRLTGVLLDYNKEFRAGFGFLVIARNKNVVSNDALAVRCEVCICLNPTHNRQGSWRMQKLTNGKIVSRSQFKIIPMTDLAQARLNELATLEDNGHPICLEDEYEYDEPENVPDDENFPGDLRNAVFDFPFINSVNDEGGGVPPITTAPNSELSPLLSNDDAMPELIEDDEDDDEAVLDNTAAVPVAAPTYSNIAQVTDTYDNVHLTTASDRAARAANRAKMVNLVAGRRMSIKKRFNNKDTQVNSGIFNITPRACVKKYGAQRSMKAQLKEVKALYDNGTFEGVLPKDLKGSRLRRIIRSFIILKEKFDAEGNFEKLKARLVANGAQMDPATHTDPSSPTVSLTFLLMMVVIAARERRTVATMDVGNAFVKASMEDEEEVLVVLDQLTAAILCQVDRSYEQFLNEKMEMVVKLKKALYGCLQSAKLWFELLVKELMQFGYVQNPVDPCVLNKTVAGKQSTLLLHVDDIMVLSQIENETAALYAHLQTKFGKVTLHEGTKHNYLGMTFDFGVANRVTITMLGYETDMVSDWFAINFDSDLLPARDKFASTPATNQIFEKGDSPLLSDAHAKLFHSYSMRLAFLAKRVKPELNVAISYLSTQVTRSTLNDLRKLDRALRYVRDHIGTGITLLSQGRGKNIVVTAHIDASFGCHDDGKSHTGVCITLGSGPVFVRSVKQKIVTKSSTEAELVALSDEAGLLFHIEDFLVSQGYTCTVVAGQDNQSTIDLITTEPKNNMRTRHIHVRYYWLRERIAKGDITILYVPTGQMLADILTKPIQGNMFRSFVSNFCFREGETVPAQETLTGV